MTGATCPVCGDRTPIWLDEPPTGCLTGGSGLCQRAMDRAQAAGLARKLCPDAYDENGALLPDQGGRVLLAMEAAGISPFTGLPRARDAMDQVLAELTRWPDEPPPPGGARDG